GPCRAAVGAAEQALVAGGDYQGQGGGAGGGAADNHAGNVQAGGRQAGGAGGDDGRPGGAAIGGKQQAIERTAISGFAGEATEAGQQGPMSRVGEVQVEGTDRQAGEAVGQGRPGRSRGAAGVVVGRLPDPAAGGADVKDVAVQGVGHHGLNGTGGRQ